jgi:uncharacterized membrane protein
MNPFYVHVAFMGAGVILMSVGIYVAHFLRKKSWWLKIHRPLGITGVVCLAFGLLAAVVMVSQGEGRHIRIPHAWLGIVSIAFAMTTPALGHLQFKIRSHSQQLRGWHRRIGYTAMILCILAILSGVAVSVYM